MNLYHEERNFLLYVATSGTSPRQIPGSINRSDYAAVCTPPSSNSIPTIGPCLIWRHGLNDGGYGILRLKGKSRLAHRAAYEMTRGEIPEGEKVLHLCYRRCCIQPAHLDAGSAKENREDKDMRLTEEGRWLAPSMVFRKYEHQMKDGMKYYWDEPMLTQPAFFPPEQHQCEYTIPAGCIKLFQICSKPAPHMLSKLGDIDFRKNEAKYRGMSREHLDDHCKGRGPGDEPFDSISAYGRIVISHVVQPLGVVPFVFATIDGTTVIHYPGSQD